MGYGMDEETPDFDDEIAEDFEEWKREQRASARRLPDPRSNPYADAARAKKVVAMLSVLASMAPQAFASPGRAADVLRVWPQEDRIALAEHAGINPPSEDTWAAFVAAVRGRA